MVAKLSTCQFLIINQVRKDLAGSMLQKGVTVSGSPDVSSVLSFILSVFRVWSQTEQTLFIGCLTGRFIKDKTGGKSGVFCGPQKITALQHSLKTAQADGDWYKKQYKGGSALYSSPGLIQISGRPEIPNWYENKLLLAEIFNVAAKPDALAHIPSEVGAWTRWGSK